MNRALKKLFSLIFVSLLIFNAAVKNVQADEEPTVSIVTQPENVEVEYPNGATFHVEVDHPENVASYQWELSDGYNVFTLDGTSATTDTMVIPYTEQMTGTNYLCCIITDKNGNKIFTEDAELTVINPDVDKPVLYLGDSAIEPGESLDLKDTLQGSGTIRFDENGTDIYFNDVHYHNDVSIYDTGLQSIGIFLFARHGQELTYTMHFDGENVIDNTMFDPEYNAGGICLNGYFGLEENYPTLLIDGDGSLTLNGGSNAIYCDGNVEIAMDITTRAMEDLYNDAITGKTILIDEGVHLDLYPNGTGIRARGDLRTYKDSVIDIHSIAPHVSVGPTVKYIVNVDGGMYMESTKLNIAGYAYPKTFEPYGSFLVNFTGIGFNGIGGLSANASVIDIALNCDKGEDLYALNFCGIVGGENSSSVDLSGASELNINLDVENVYGATGILVPGDLNADKDSKIAVRIRSQGEAAAIEADRAILFNDASVDVSAISLDESNTFGIVSSDISIALNDKKYSVYSNAPNGIALAADTGNRSTEVKKVDGYQPSVIKLSDKAVISKPQKANINLHGVPGYDDIIAAETIFEGDSQTPAQEVLISFRKDNTPWIIAGIAGVAALACIAYMLSRKKKNKTAKAV